MIVVIEDESSRLSDEELAEATAEWLAEISAGPIIDLGDIDVAELIREERADRGE